MYFNSLKLFIYLTLTWFKTSESGMVLTPHRGQITDFFQIMNVHNNGLKDNIGESSSSKLRFNSWRSEGRPHRNRELKTKTRFRSTFRNDSPRMKSDVDNPLKKVYVLKPRQRFLFSVDTSIRQDTSKFQPNIRQKSTTNDTPAQRNYQRNGHNSNKFQKATFRNIFTNAKTGNKGEKVYEISSAVDVDSHYTNTGMSTAKIRMQRQQNTHVERIEFNQRELKEKTLRVDGTVRSRIVTAREDKRIDENIFSKEHHNQFTNISKTYSSISSRRVEDIGNTVIDRRKKRKSTRDTIFKSVKQEKSYQWINAVYKRPRPISPSAMIPSPKRRMPFGIKTENKKWHYQSERDRKMYSTSQYQRQKSSTRYWSNNLNKATNHRHPQQSFETDSQIRMKQIDGRLLKRAQITPFNIDYKRRAGFLIKPFSSKWTSLAKRKKNSKFPSMTNRARRYGHLTFKIKHHRELTVNTKGPRSYSMKEIHPVLASSKPRRLRDQRLYMNYTHDRKRVSLRCLMDGNCIHRRTRRVEQRHSDRGVVREIDIALLKSLLWKVLTLRDYNLDPKVGEKVNQHVQVHDGNMMLSQNTRFLKGKTRTAPFLTVKKTHFMRPSINPQVWHTLIKNISRFYKRLMLSKQHDCPLLFHIYKAKYIKYALHPITRNISRNMFGLLKNPRENIRSINDRVSVIILDLKAKGREKNTQKKQWVLLREIGRKLTKIIESVLSHMTHTLHLLGHTLRKVTTVFTHGNNDEKLTRKVHKTKIDNMSALYEKEYHRNTSDHLNTGPSMGVHNVSETWLSPFNRDKMYNTKNERFLWLNYSLGYRKSHESNRNREKRRHKIAKIETMETEESKEHRSNTSSNAFGRHLFKFKSTNRRTRRSAAEQIDSSNLHVDRVNSRRHKGHHLKDLLKHKAAKRYHAHTGLVDPFKYSWENIDDLPDGDTKALQDKLRQLMLRVKNHKRGNLFHEKQTQRNNNPFTKTHLDEPMESVIINSLSSAIKNKTKGKRGKKQRLRHPTLADRKLLHNIELLTFLVLGGDSNESTDALQERLLNVETQTSAMPANSHTELRGKLHHPRRKEGSGKKKWSVGHKKHTLHKRAVGGGSYYKSRNPNNSRNKGGMNLDDSFLDSYTSKEVKHDTFPERWKSLKSQLEMLDKQMTKTQTKYANVQKKIKDLLKEGEVLAKKVINKLGQSENDEAKARNELAKLESERKNLEYKIREEEQQRDRVEEEFMRSGIGGKVNDIKDALSREDDQLQGELSMQRMDLNPRRQRNFNTQSRTRPTGRGRYGTSLERADNMDDIGPRNFLKPGQFDLNAPNKRHSTNKTRRRPTDTVRYSSILDSSDNMLDIEPRNELKPGQFETGDVTRDDELHIVDQMLNKLLEGRVKRSSGQSRSKAATRHPSNSQKETNNSGEDVANGRDIDLPVLTEHFQDKPRSAAGGGNAWKAVGTKTEDVSSDMVKNDDMKESGEDENVDEVSKNSEVNQRAGSPAWGDIDLAPDSDKSKDKGVSGKDTNEDDSRLRTGIDKILSLILARDKESQGRDEGTIIKKSKHVKDENNITDQQKFPDAVDGPQDARVSNNNGSTKDDKSNAPFQKTFDKSYGWSHDDKKSKKPLESKLKLQHQQLQQRRYGVKNKKDKKRTEEMKTSTEEQKLTELPKKVKESEHKFLELQTVAKEATKDLYSLFEKAKEERQKLWAEKDKERKEREEKEAQVLEDLMRDIDAQVSWLKVVKDLKAEEVQRENAFLQEAERDLRKRRKDEEKWQKQQ